jgi:hypothetical protein
MEDYISDGFYGCTILEVSQRLMPFVGNADTQRWLEAPARHVARRLSQMRC